MWVATVEHETGDVYYVNTQTDVVSWDRPVPFNGPLVRLFVCMKVFRILASFISS
jgi:hypothetical protein